MFVDCRDCPLRSLPLFRTFSDAEADFIRAIKIGHQAIAARRDLIREGDDHLSVYTLFSGWAFRYMMLDSGCRQILDILLPGDLVGLQSPLTGRVRRSVRTATAAVVCRLDGDALRALFQEHPSLSEALVTTLLYEEQRADTRLLLLGRQRPTERLGYFLLELRDRLLGREMTSGEAFDLPLSYEQLADAIGVSRSQVGASLGELRRRGWAELRGGRVGFADCDGMAAGCGYVRTPEQEVRTLI
jgi:CRP/FNR family transcriptional regulator, anaerobic regulatory protein